MKPLLDAEHFEVFFREVHGYPPFPWQQMLAEKVTSGHWPSCIDLPTASGKTACIDIAVFALACQADLPTEQRTAPRRVFFVVDRRIVVDEAFERAKRLARKLADARDGVTRVVADRLRALSSASESDEPLVVTRMRGGVALDDGWVRDPSRPAVITSTVDQVGSRLLFRGYGRSPRVAAIDAGLVGNDALFILDEAHCAVPFSQTLAAVQEYRSAHWAQVPVINPFRVVVMSATPPGNVRTEQHFPARQERDRALDAEHLLRRIQAVKHTELVIARTPRRPRKGEPGLRSEPITDDSLVLDAVDRALKAAASGPKRIAVMVNRVATARAIWKQLFIESRLEGNIAPFDVVLLTGRMRPYDRDRIIAEWKRVLGAKEQPEPLTRSVILVTTQCLEVGADFSFDVLITECASLDALRQRFGRLDRLGVAQRSEAAILIRMNQVKTPEQIEKLEEAGKLDDPIYGNALASTWNWLVEHANRDGDGRLWIDMGISGLEAHLPSENSARLQLLRQLSAPAPNAPALLPTHLDQWVQTSPRPRPDPDITVFLHGSNRGEPEVTVVLRDDLEFTGAREEESGVHSWIQAVSLLPPSSPEAFSVPLRLVRQWIASGTAAAEELTDVESIAVAGGEPEFLGPGRNVVVWRGRDRSIVTSDPQDVRPGDIVVIPARYGLPEAFGAVPQDDNSQQLIDIAEAVSLGARGRAVIRVHHRILGQWKDNPRVGALLEWAAEPDREMDPGELFDILADLAEHSSDTVESPLPNWLLTAAQVLSNGCEIAQHPCGGYVIWSKKPIASRSDFEWELDAFSDEDDIWSEASFPVSLSRHLEETASVARDYAIKCLPEHFVDPIVRAAELHDFGKVDPRFQQMLHGGNQLASLLELEPIAKSADLPTSREARRRAYELSGLPRGFRHEGLSVQLAEHFFDLPEDQVARDLVVYLIATHHGYARPLMPVVFDPDPPSIDAQVGSVSLSVDSDQHRAWPATFHLSSGTSDRFGRIIRRHGWWGSALLEAILRLADWTASTRTSREYALTGVKLVAAGGEQ